MFLQIARTETDAAKADINPPRFIAADMHALPLLDQSADTIISHHTMNYSEDVAQLLDAGAQQCPAPRQRVSSSPCVNVVGMRSASKHLQAPVSTYRGRWTDRQFHVRNSASSSQEWFDALPDCGFQVTLSQQLDANEKWNNDSPVQTPRSKLFAQTMHADCLPAF